VVAGPQSNRGYLPVGQEERLEAAFPRDSQSVREAIEGYLDFSDYPPAEWSSSDLAEAQCTCEQRIAQAFPELSARSIDALAYRRSYSWR